MVFAKVSYAILAAIKKKSLDRVTNKAPKFTSHGSPRPRPQRVCCGQESSSSCVAVEGWAAQRGLLQEDSNAIHDGASRMTYSPAKAPPSIPSPLGAEF